MPVTGDDTWRGQMEGSGEQAIKKNYCPSGEQQRIFKINWPILWFPVPYRPNLTLSPHTTPPSLRANIPHISPTITICLLSPKMCHEALMPSHEPSLRLQRRDLTEVCHSTRPWHTTLTLELPPLLQTGTALSLNGAATLAKMSTSCQRIPPSSS